MTQLKVLIVDDSEDDALLVARQIRKGGHDLEFLRVDTCGDMEAALKDRWDLVISDVNMPKFSVDQALMVRHRLVPHVPLIVVSGAVGEEAAVSYLKNGADDFVLKGNLARLVPAMERALRDADVRQARQRAEEELRAAKIELEKALVSKSRFLAAASHDLRQPVQAIFCFQEILKTQLTDPSAQAVVSNLGESLDGLKVLLDSLLDISRLDSGLTQADIKQVALGPLLTRICGQLALVACQKGLKLRLVPSRATVLSDPMLLERILRNLIENAIKYSDSGRILVGCRIMGGQIRVEIWDTGIGIPDELSTQIFEEFFQVANSERDRTRGIGLGLSIVQRLCRILDHRISLQSVPGKGSTFGVVMPFAGWAASSGMESGALCPKLASGEGCAIRRVNA